MKKQILSLFLASAVALLTVNSCGKKKNPKPDLPPSATMQMNTDDFDQSKTGPQRIDSTTTNWVHSAVNVGVWQFILTVTLIVPVASYHEAFNHEPKYKGKNKGWLWKYNFDVAGINHTAELYGNNVNGKVEWKMYMTKDGEYKDFLWYEGVSDQGNTSGTWTLYKDPNNSSKFLDIVWSKNTSSGTYDITYTGTDGSYINYGVNTANNLDAYYTIYNASNTNKIDIEWNRSSKNGRVRDLNKYATLNWQCWDNTLHDANCN